MRGQPTEQHGEQREPERAVAAAAPVGGGRRQRLRRGHGGQCHDRVGTGMAPADQPRGVVGKGRACHQPGVEAAGQRRRRGKQRGAGRQGQRVAVGFEAHAAGVAKVTEHGHHAVAAQQALVVERRQVIGIEGKRQHPGKTVVAAVETAGELHELLAGLHRAARRQDAQRRRIISLVKAERGRQARAGAMMAAGAAQHAAVGGINGDLGKCRIGEHAVAVQRIELQGAAALLPAMLELHGDLVHLGDAAGKVVLERIDVSSELAPRGLLDIAPGALGAYHGVIPADGRRQQGQQQPGPGPISGGVRTQDNIQGNKSFRMLSQQYVRRVTLRDFCSIYPAAGANRTAIALAAGTMLSSAWCSSGSSGLHSG
ncbi:hypothetical protein DUPY_20950 [Duganella phyllosphaerae]|uniref:Uncharacterized protein n=1 Tax=Duganella phyllosphaerae TaxID=762836 RepID=A0A1E7WRV3_9BURK|nr:hypothetical protein DUPY_20950 [Duganella phyllosphaerae]